MVEPEFQNQILSDPAATHGYLFPGAAEAKTVRHTGWMMSAVLMRTTVEPAVHKASAPSPPKQIIHPDLKTPAHTDISLLLSCPLLTPFLS